MYMIGKSRRPLGYARDNISFVWFLTINHDNLCPVCQPISNHFVCFSPNQSINQSNRANVGEGKYKIRQSIVLLLVNTPCTFFNSSSAVGSHRCGLFLKPCWNVLSMLLLSRILSDVAGKYICVLSFCTLQIHWSEALVYNSQNHIAPLS